ncbi:MAG: methyltransferase domain-containing protein [Candidatus Desulfaltia sp.]|nr:methyltransferase domain-containing protein [Candidatus Desulfaltia sp.]
MLERLLATAKTPWKMNNLQLTTELDLQVAIKNGDIFLCKRDVCLCSSHNKIRIASIDRFGLDFSSYICKNCGLVFTSPYICENSLPFYYNKYYHPLHFGTNKPIKSLFSKGQGLKIFNFAKEYLNSSYIKIFEMGAGCGTNLLEFAKVAKKYGIKADCCGTEYNADYVQYGNKKGLKITTDSIEEYVSKTIDKFDLIILSHIFEHLTNPTGTLNLFKKISHENTLLYIEVPGIMNLKTQYVYDCDFLKYLTHAHTFNFSLSSLRATLNYCGFELVQGNEKIESIFRMNRHINKTPSTQVKNVNYKEILSYLTELEANLAFYQSKNPANSVYNRLKRKIRFFIEKLTGEI